MPAGLAAARRRMGCRCAWMMFGFFRQEYAGMKISTSLRSARMQMRVCFIRRQIPLLLSYLGHMRRFTVGVSQYVERIAHFSAGAADVVSVGRWVREVSVHLVVKS